MAEVIISDEEMTKSKKTSNMIEALFETNYVHSILFDKNNDNNNKICEKDITVIIGDVENIYATNSNDRKNRIIPFLILENEKLGDIMNFFIEVQKFRELFRHGKEYY